MAVLYTLPQNSYIIEYLERYNDIQRCFMCFRNHALYNGKCTILNNTVLIIVNFHNRINIGKIFLEKEFFPEFAKIYKYDFDVFFTGPKYNRTLGIFSNGLPFRGHYSYHSFEVARKNINSFNEYLGVFLINDDSCIKPSTLNLLDHKLAMSENYKPYFINITNWGWTNRKNVFGKKFVNAEINAVKRIEQYEKVNMYYGYSDFFYIPQGQIEKFSIYENIMYEERSFLEFSIPTIMSTLNHTKIPDCNYNKHRKACVHYHPMKYSIKEKSKACMKYMMEF